MPTDDDLDTEYDKAEAERVARERKRHDLLCSLLANALVEKGPSLRHALSECKPYTIRELASVILSPDEIVEAVYDAAEREIEAQVKKRVDEMRAKLRTQAKAASAKPAAPKPAAKALPAEPMPSLDAAIVEAAMAGELPDSFAAGDAAKLSPKASRGIITGALERLVAAGKLTRTGKARGTKYTLAPAPAASAKPASSAKRGKAQPALFDDADESDENDLEDQLDHALDAADRGESEDDEGDEE